MFTDIKVLLGIKDNSKDNILNIYIRRAITTIQNYLNNDKFTKEYIEENFKDAIIAIVVNAYEIKQNGNGNIKSLTQGNRSVTYANNTAFYIDKDIASLLPQPYVKMW